MAELLALAQVWLWDKFVGAVTEEDDGRITFEYDEAFRRSGLEISPRKLPPKLSFCKITTTPTRSVSPFSSFPITNPGRSPARIPIL